MFQSAPLTEARGDALPSGWRGNLPSFNPLPLPKQGETLPIVQPIVSFDDVSIRSPHRSKGRPTRSPITSAALTCFNPLPSPKQGETFLCWGCGFRLTCFNPLPSPKQGETGETVRIQHLDRVSIRSPHRSKGRRGPEILLLCQDEFQSAPLTEARGDSRTIPLYSQATRFQSAPLTEARGDIDDLKDAADYRSVSIRSPHRSKGRPKIFRVIATTLRVSIRSPHRSKGRHGHRGRVLHS